MVASPLPFYLVVLGERETAGGSPSTSMKKHTGVDTQPNTKLSLKAITYLSPGALVRSLLMRGTREAHPIQGNEPYMATGTQMVPALGRGGGSHSPVWGWVNPSSEISDQTEVRRDSS